MGLRGARVAAYAENPDAAVVLECTAANEVPTTQGRQPLHAARAGPGDHGHGQQLHRGSAAGGALSRRGASGPGIPHQFKQPNIGGTDAGAIQRVREGVPSITIAVPARYIHSPAAIMNEGDFEGTVALRGRRCRRLGPSCTAPS